jgi:hypothetical protein
MRNETIATIAGRRVVLMDSISLISAEDAGALIVCGSHGGAISAAFALRHPPALVLFNDAGGGKNGAGRAAIDILDASGIACATFTHLSARIGDAQDAWLNGRLGAVNHAAAAAGAAPGQSVRQAIEGFRAEGP